MQPGTPQRKPGQFATTLESAERQKAACELHAQGYDYDEIALELGYADRSGAWRAVRTALKNLPAPAANVLRRIQIHDLLEIHRAHHPLACGLGTTVSEHGEKIPAPPSKDSADVCLKVAARIAALYGLDQPKSLRVEMDRQNTLVLNRLEKELPANVFEQVLAIIAGGESGGDALGDPSEAPAGDAVEGSEGA